MPPDDPMGQVPVTPPVVETPATPNDPAQVAGEPFDAARAQALIDKLRPFEKEADRLKKANAALETRVTEFEKGKLTETERLQAERDEAVNRSKQAEARAQERAIRAEVVTAAAKLNIVDPDAAHKLLDISAIELNASGDPTNIEKLLADLVKAKPYLVGQAAGNSPMNPQRGGGDVAETDAQKRARIYGSNNSIFDPRLAVERGGGVLFDPAVNPKQIRRD